VWRPALWWLGVCPDPNSKMAAGVTYWVTLRSQAQSDPEGPQAASDPEGPTSSLLSGAGAREGPGGRGDVDERREGERVGGPFMGSGHECTDEPPILQMSLQARERASTDVGTCPSLGGVGKEPCSRHAVRF
jgi:hypothetical protein